MTEQKSAKDTKAQPNGKHTTKGRKIRGATMRGGVEDSWRFRTVWLMMGVGLSLLVVRAFYLQVANREFYAARADEFITSKRTTTVHRGQITDAFGVPLAISAPLVSVVFSPYDYAQSYYRAKKDLATAKSEKQIQKAQKKLDRLSLSRLAQAAKTPLTVLEQAAALKDIDVEDSEAVHAALPKGVGSKRLVLAKDITPEEAQEVLSLDFVGISTETKQKRFYPQAEPNAQILGYMAQSDSDGGYHGRSGIEAKYETTLAGKAGQVLVLKNADQYALKELKELKPKTEAKSVALTIDARLQYLLFKELERVGREQDGLWASGIVVDIATGNILAAASWPSFNSNDLSSRTGATERNRVFLDSFEPGSVMKPITVAAALESGKYSTNSVIDTSPGVLRVQGHSIKDSHNYGAVTLAKLIEKSSNVASTKIALSLPPSAIVDMQRRFGFGKKTAIDFPAEQSGVLKTPEANDLARRATLSYGYGQAVTLAQLVQAYATFGNYGTMRPLRLVESEPVLPTQEVISTQHAKDILAMMELVTQKGGTAKDAAIDGYRVAGKTGTSRRASPTGGYLPNEYRAIFAGVAPASKPVFAAAILVESPKDNFGGKVSAPVFSRVMGEALRLYHVPYDKPLKTQSD